jgi:drug/metabolite transporter (DMT)-like permease
MAETHAIPARPAAAEFRFGVLLVAGAALFWSFGGTIARYISTPDPWTVVFWRALFASTFLLLFMLWRDGPKGTAAMFRGMGLPGLGVAVCFGIASSCFVIALQYTTVANILLTQAAAPLFAALLAWMIFGERVNLPTWFAIAAVICGVAIMVSASFSGQVSPIGDGLAVVITVLFSVAIVITRHHPEVRMMPAVCLGTGLASVAGFFLSGAIAVSVPDLAWLVLFGAINLGATLLAVARAQLEKVDRVLRAAGLRPAGFTLALPALPGALGTAAEGQISLWLEGDGAVLLVGLQGQVGGVLHHLPGGWLVGHGVVLPPVLAGDVVVGGLPHWQRDIGAGECEWQIAGGP